MKDHTIEIARIYVPTKRRKTLDSAVVLLLLVYVIAGELRRNPLQEAE